MGSVQRTVPVAVPYRDAARLRSADLAPGRDITDWGPVAGLESSTLDGFKHPAFLRCTSVTDTISSARYDRLSAPVAWIHICLCLRQYPTVPEWVDHAGLAFAVRPVARGGRRVRAASAGSGEHRVDVVDSKHHLVACSGHPFTVVKLAHDQFSTLTIDTELHAVRFANADVFDQSKNLDVPRDRFPHVGNAKDRNHACPRR